MKRASERNTAKGLLVGAIAILLVLGISAVIFFYVQAQRSPTIKAGTTEVKPRAYANKSLLSSITIPDSVTRIGEQAFSKCQKLQSVEIPNSVKEIGRGAFEGCYELSSVTLPEGISTIRGLTFDSCKSLTDIVIPNSVTLIEEAAFSNCESLTTVTLGCGIEKVEKDAFRNCSSVKKLIFADGTIEIHGWGFKHMTEVSIPDSATAISDQAFMNCHELTSLTIPENVTSIGNQAFTFCDSLKEVYIGSGVREIGWEAFADCGSLKEVYIGSGVREIALEAFEDCESLTDFTVSPDNPCFVSVDGIVLDREMAHIVFCPRTLIDQNRAFIPSEWAEEETLDAASALKNVNSRVIPLNTDGEVDMNLFARLPEDRRALTAADADYALVVRVSNDESDDYVVKGSFEKVYGMYDTATRAYLCAKDGAIAKLCEIWHSPPDSGSVTRFGGLAMGNQWGDRATTSEIWSEIEDMFE